MGGSLWGPFCSRVCLRQVVEILHEVLCRMKPLPKVSGGLSALKSAAFFTGGGGGGGGRGVCLLRGYVGYNSSIAATVLHAVAPFWCALDRAMPKTSWHCMPHVYMHIWGRPALHMLSMHSLCYSVGRLAGRGCLGGPHTMIVTNWGAFARPCRPSRPEHWREWVCIFFQLFCFQHPARGVAVPGD